MPPAALIASATTFVLGIQTNLLVGVMCAIVFGGIAWIITSNFSRKNNAAPKSEQPSPQIPPTSQSKSAINNIDPLNLSDLALRDIGKFLARSLEFSCPEETPTDVEAKILEESNVAIEDYHIENYALANFAQAYAIEIGLANSPHKKEIEDGYFEGLGELDNTNPELHDEVVARYIAYSMTIKSTQTDHPYNETPVEAIEGVFLANIEIKPEFEIFLCHFIRNAFEGHFTQTLKILQKSNLTSAPRQS